MLTIDNLKYIIYSFHSGYFYNVNSLKHNIESSVIQTVKYRKKNYILNNKYRIFGEKKRITTISEELDEFCKFICEYDLSVVSEIVQSTITIPLEDFYELVEEKYEKTYMYIEYKSIILQILAYFIQSNSLKRDQRNLNIKQGYKKLMDITKELPEKKIYYDDKKIKKYYNLYRDFIFIYESPLYQKTLVLLNKKIDKLIDENDDYYNRNEELEKIKEILEEQNDEFEEQNKELKKLQSKIEEDNKRLIDVVNKKKDKKNKLKRKLVRTNSQIQILEDKLEGKEKIKKENIIVSLNSDIDETERWQYLKKMKATSGQKRLRYELWYNYFEEFEIGNCFCCLDEIHFDNPGWHCGHILSDYEGGLKEHDNLHPICAKCNLSMKEQHMYKYMIYNQVEGIRNLDPSIIEQYSEDHNLCQEITRILSDIKGERNKSNLYITQAVSGWFIRKSMKCNSNQLKDIHTFVLSIKKLKKKKSISNKNNLSLSVLHKEKIIPKYVKKWLSDRSYNRAVTLFIEGLSKHQ